MARNPENQNFPHTVALRLSREQMAFVESARGSLSPSAYLRLLVVREKRRSFRKPEGVSVVAMEDLDDTPSDTN